MQNPSLTKEQVRTVASLARLHFCEEGIVVMEKELNSIMHWIDQLKQVDVEGVSNYSEESHHFLPEREDMVTDGNKVQDVLANAPEQAHGLFGVPKVIE